MQYFGENSSPSAPICRAQAALFADGTNQRIKAQKIFEKTRKYFDFLAEVWYYNLA